MKSEGDNQTQNQTKADDILLYIPNLIGYGRLCLLLLAYFCIELPIYFLILYCLSISLDLFDGWSARKLNQCSAFGAWLDVIVDNISRTCIWTNICSWGWILISIEWVTFVCNHQAGSKWREYQNSSKKGAVVVVTPKWMLKVMENGFKTPLGTWVILGLHCLPVWIFAMQHGITDLFISYPTSLVVCLLLIAGRIVCLGCELWCIKKHIMELLNEDVSISTD